MNSKKESDSTRESSRRKFLGQGAALAAMTAAGIGTVAARRPDPDPAQRTGQSQARPDPLHWTNAAPFPEPEEELYGSVANGKMYVVGGFGYHPFGKPPGLVYEYDPNTDKWTKMKNIPIPVHHQAQAAYNGKIYIFGGCLRHITGEDSSTNVWEFDPAANSYKALAPIPNKRCSAVAEEVNGKIYLIGGIMPMEDGKPGTRVTGLNQVYDPASNNWETRSPMPTTRNHAYSGVVNGKIYVIGGRQGAGRIPITSNTDIVEEYDPEQDLWTLKERMPTPRSGGGVATYGTKIYVAGGELQNRQLRAAFQALEAYDAATDTWTILPSMPSARHGVAGAFLGNKLHLVSGKMEGGGAPDMGNPATASHNVLEIPDA
jgi:Kelch motif